MQLAIATAASGSGFGEESAEHPGMLCMTTPQDLGGWRLNRRALIASGAVSQAFLNRSDTGLDSIVFQAPSGSTSRGPKTKLFSTLAQPIKLLFAGKVHHHSLGAVGSFKPTLCCPLPPMDEFPSITFMLAPSAQMCCITSDMRAPAWFVRGIPKDSDEPLTMVTIYEPMLLPEASGMPPAWIMVPYLVPNPEAKQTDDNELRELTRHMFDEEVKTPKSDKAYWAARTGFQARVNTRPERPGSWMHLRLEGASTIRTA